MVGSILCPQCLFLVINLTNSWEAFHNQFCPMALGKLIPRSGEDSVDRLLNGLHFLDEALLII